MQDFITQIMFCVALGCALSPVAAVALSPCRNDAVLGILPRLAMAAGPVYLVANYLLYQGTAFAACAAAAFALGLYILRGWWVPDRALDFFRHRSQRRAGVALHARVLTVVHDDRHAARPNVDRSMPRAA